jgi:hypothetical protein
VVLSRRSFLRGLGLTAGASLLPGAVASALPRTDVLGAPRASLPYLLVQLARVRATVEQTDYLGANYDLTEHGHQGRYDVVLWPGDGDRLRRDGFEFDVVVPDLVGRDIEERLAEARAAQQTPAGQVTYRFLADYEREMEALAAEHPHIVRRFVLPHTTHEGRTVAALELASDVNAQRDGRPASLIMGLHHAREWPSAELTMDFAVDLVARHRAGDPATVALLDGVRLFVIPVVNPDGFVRSRETISDFLAPLPGVAALAGEFAYHRKNMRRHGAVPLTGQGVDPNRNYPYKWGGGGTSASTAGATYHGPSPASEPEIRNVLELLKSEQVVTLISNHTYSDLVLRPFGDTLLDTPDEPDIKGHADAMAAINGYRSIKGLQLYITTGTTEDWVYGVTGAYAFTFEIGSAGIIGLGNTLPTEAAGFHPQYNLHVRNFYSRNAGAFLLNVQKAMDTGSHVVLEGRAPAGTVLTVEKSVVIPLSKPDPALPDAGRTRVETVRTTLAVGDSGAYTWHLNPSPTPQTLLDGRAKETYTLTAVRPDGTTVVDAAFLAERGKRYTRDF